MPEISFYITTEERKELFDFIKSNNGMLVIKTIYEELKAMEVQNKEELMEHINNQTQTSYFVISSQFQTEPLAMDQFEEKYGQLKGKYYIMQRAGGPYINISFSLGFSDDAPIKYVQTNIHHYARYLHYDWQTNYGEFPATEELKSYYKMIVKFLKSKCRQVTAKNGKKYWVSKTLKEEDVV